MKLESILCASVLALTIAAVQAQSFKAGAITIEHPYARATAAGQPSGGGYLTLVNGGGTDRLLSASADVSKSVELHEMKLEGDVMRMRQVDGIELPAGKTVQLKPGGFHVMFLGLKAPLKAGESFPLTLRFEKAGQVSVDVKVEAAGAGAAAGAMSGMPGMKP